MLHAMHPQSTKNHTLPLLISIYDQRQSGNWRRRSKENTGRQETKELTVNAGPLVPGVGAGVGVGAQRIVAINGSLETANSVKGTLPAASSRVRKIRIDCCEGTRSVSS